MLPNSTKSKPPSEPTLNVLIIGEYFPPDIGGAATRAYNVAKGLASSGCNVTVVTAFPHYPSGNIPPTYKNKPLRIEYVGKTKVIRTTVLPIESKGLFKRLLIFFSFIVSSLFALPFVGKPDVIWAANPDMFVLVPAITYSTLKRRPLVSNVDDLLIEDLYDLNLIKRGSFLSKIAETSARALFAKVDAATPISPGYTKTIIKYGLDGNKITVVLGGVDLNVFKPLPKKQSGQKFVVLYSGGFSIAYDFEQVFQAAKVIEQLDTDVTFIIQGKGELLNSMCQRIKQLKLTNVHIIDKLLSRTDVAKFLSQADVLILPLANFNTPYRGMSAKLYEYQAVGKPIICCSLGVPAMFVEKTNSGLVIKPGDYQALAISIVQLKSNPEVAQTYAENGLKYVRSAVSIEAIGRIMKQLLQKIEA
jgi:glycosyltransferase involved in cell wall biosynthesis